MAGEALLVMLKNIIEDGCWHSDGEIITDDCANLDCHECFVAKALKHSGVNIIKGTEHTEEFDHRLDKPDREKIKAIVVNNLTEYHTADGLVKVKIEKMLDQILALIPTEEEMRKQERERIFSKFDNEYEVIQTLGKPSPYITFKVRRDEWQALKEGA